MDYPRLASALLQQGESLHSIIRFLCVEYGLEDDRARAAIVLAQAAPDETERTRERLTLAYARPA